MRHLSPRKRLAFLLPDLSGGGAERVALTLAEDFSGRGYAVDLVLMARRGSLLPLVPPEVRIVDLQAPRIRNSVIPFARYLRRARPHAVEAYMWPLTVSAVAAHRIARSDARLVLSEQITLSKQYGHFGAAKLSLMKASIRAAYPLANARLAASARAADDLATLSGIARESVEVVYNPIQLPDIAPAQSEEIDALWGGARLRLINVGALKEQKNQALLIKAFARLPASLGAKLLILGEGDLRPRLEGLAAAERIEERIIFAGFKADPWPYYTSAHLFVLSSDYEGFGNVVAEALHAGLSVVSTDCESGPREILDDGRYGTLVPCGDAEALASAISASFNQPADSERLKARARAISGPKVIERHLQLMLGASTPP